MNINIYCTLEKKHMMKVRMVRRESGNPNTVCLVTAQVQRASQEAGR